MRMREIDYSGPLPVDGYGPGGFRIGGVWHEGALLLGPEGVGPVALPLDAAALAPLIALAPRIDLVLVGLGAEAARLPADLLERIEGAGIGAEVMATPPACRSYNMLLAEGRRVAALLVPV